MAVSKTKDICHCTGGHLHALYPCTIQTHTTGEGKRAQYTLADGLRDEIVVTIIHLLQFYDVVKMDCIYDYNTINKSSFILTRSTGQTMNNKFHGLWEHPSEGKYEYFSCMEL